MNKVWWYTGWAMLLAVAVWSVPGWTDEAISVKDAWVREAPPQAEVSAAYFTLHNPAAQARKLVSVSSPQFQRVEIHSTRMVDGQMRMQRLNEFVIEPQSSVEFKPEGYHLMLFQPVQPLKAGDMVELTLQFADTSRLTVQAQVRKAGEEGQSHHHHDMTM
jgi:copper(I)-binding protein